MSMQKFSFLSQKLWTCPPPPIYSLLTRDYPLCEFHHLYDYFEEIILT